MDTTTKACATAQQWFSDFTSALTRAAGEKDAHAVTVYLQRNVFGVT